MALPYNEIGVAQMKLEQAIKSIKPLNKNIMEQAQKRLDNLTKPLGSLGRLEMIAKQIVGITGQLMPDVSKKRIIIMCADNGVTDKGVSSCPKSVTKEVTINFTKGITGINVLSKEAGAKICIVDIGVDADIEEKGILNKKIRKGTWDISEGPAMTREEAVRAIEIGIETVAEMKKAGVTLLGTGEMGIGNTTTSSAVAIAITGMPLEKMVGKGSGMTKEGYNNKIEVIRQALCTNKPAPMDGIDVLAKVGGFDIAGLAGCYIGAAAFQIPILMDGFISCAAALAAITIEPRVREFIIPSHGSAEPGTKGIFEALNMEPLLNLGMRLGEGTGAAIGFHIIDAAMAAYTEMGTFEQAHIEKYVPLE